MSTDTAHRITAGHTNGDTAAAVIELLKNRHLGYVDVVNGSGATVATLELKELTDTAFSVFPAVHAGGHILTGDTVAGLGVVVTARMLSQGSVDGVRNVRTAIMRAARAARYN